MLLFDTSAIIGLVERRNRAGELLIEERKEIPLCHFVSLGELQSGVRTARKQHLGAEVVGLRLGRLHSHSG